MTITIRNNFALTIGWRFSCLLLVSSPSAFGQTYSVVDLGISQDAGSQLDGMAINSHGQVAGIETSGNEQPFITVAGNLAALSALHGNSSARAVAINSSGTIAGYSCTPKRVCDAVLWNGDGDATPTEVAANFYPSALNDNGEIAGSTLIGQDYLPATLLNGVVTRLPLLPAPQGAPFDQIPYGMNNNGEVAGEVFFYEEVAVVAHAVVWSGSKVQDLGTDAGAMALNEHGQVVGQKGGNAALWTNGVFTDLGGLGGFTEAVAINEAGTIVGLATSPADQQYAMVWIDGVMHNLNDMIDPKTPISTSLVAASWINDAGQILAGGFDGRVLHTYILNPAGVARVAAAPTMTLLPRTYASPQSVPLVDVTAGASIHYTLDGSTPTQASAVYKSAITIDATATLKAIAVATGFTESAVASATYTIVAPSVPSTPVGLSSVANVLAIGPMGLETHAGLDGLGNVYAADLIGTSLFWSGVEFDFLESATASGASGAQIALPAGKFSGIKLLGTATGGNRSHETFVVNYTDGTSTSVIRAMSDWATPQSYSGESVALTMEHRIGTSGVISHGPYHLYGYTLEVDSTKTVKSLTLPASQHVIVLATALIGTAEAVKSCVGGFSDVACHLGIGRRFIQKSATSGMAATPTA